MLNMNLLSRLGGIATAVKPLVASTARFNWQSVARSFNRLNSYTKDCNSNGMNNKGVESLQHMETLVCTSRLLSSSFGQHERRSKLNLRDDKQVTSPYKRKLERPQNGALFGNRGHDVITCLKVSQGRLTQQSLPVRHFSGRDNPIPEVLEPLLKMQSIYGDTYACYFSDENVERIRTISRSEFRILSASQLGTVYSQEKLMSQPVQKFSEDKIFGLPLDLLRKKDTEFKKKIPQLKIPALLHLMLQYIYKNGLTTKGIFKTPEDSTKVKELKEDIEANFYKNPNYEIDNKYNVHDVAAALKDFIAELQMPLVTTPEFRSFPNFFKKTPFIWDLLTGLQLYFQCLTPEHRDSLQLLLTVLNELTLNSQENGFTLQDCAETFWPALFHLPPGLSEEQTQMKKKTFYDLTRVFVFFNDRLFEVLPVIQEKLYQVHKTGVEPHWFNSNEALEYKRRMKFFNDVTFQVKPQNPKEKTTEMIVNEQTTAEEIVAFATGEKIPMESYMEKLKCQILGKDSVTSHFMHEKGGFLGYKHDIDERIIAPNSKPLYLWRLNTAAVFVFKSWNGYSKRMSVKSTGKFYDVNKFKKPDYGDKVDGTLVP